MKLYHYVICFVLIIVGAFSSIELVKLFNVKSAEYGNAITIETKNNYTEISKFDYGSLSFDTQDYSTYTNISTFAPQTFNGRANNNSILFNDTPTSNVVVNAGKISGDLIMTFYDLNGDEASVANVHILVEYYASGTRVTLTITNVDSSISYFTTYTNLNGAVIKVVQRG